MGLQTVSSHKRTESNWYKRNPAEAVYLLKKITTRDHARYMETTPVKKADVLFYPGCYIYSTKTVRQTLRLLESSWLFLYGSWWCDSLLWCTTYVTR